MNSTQTPVYRRRSFKIAVLVLILFLALLVFTPRIISYGLVTVLMDQGLDEVVVENVDFNPFTGRLAIEMLQARKDGDIVLTLEKLGVRLAWLPLGKRRVELIEVRVDGLLLDLEQKQNGDLVIAGIAIAASSGAESEQEGGKIPWGVAIHRLNIRDSQLFVNLPEQRYRAEIHQASLQRLLSWEPEQSSILKLDGAINAGRVHVDMAIRPFAEVMQLQGKLALADVELGDYAHFAGDALQVLSGTLSLNNTLDIELGSEVGLRLGQQGDVQVQALQLEQQAFKLRHKALSWDGKMQLVSSLQGGIPDIGMQGKLSHAGMEMELRQQALVLRYDDFGWNGQVQLADNLDETLKLNGELALAGLGVNRGRVGLVRLPKVSIHALASEGLKMIRADNILLTDPVLLVALDRRPDVEPVVTASSIGLEELQFDDMSKLSIASVRIRDGVSSIVRNQDGKLAVISRMSEPTAVQAQKAEATKEQAEKKHDKTPMRIRIGEVVLEGNSQVRFTDGAVQPVFDVALDIESFRLSELNSAQPEQAALYELSGKLGKYATVDLKGDVKPFLAQPSVSMKGVVKGYDLPPLSSYTAGALGYDLSSGQLDADITVGIQQGKIEAENDLVLNNLNVQVSDPDRIKGLTTQLSMPLDAALSMLRDKQNNIHLKLPVTGDLDNPQFNLGDIINTALGNVMKKTAMTYLTQALQPYGALITIGKLVGKLANAVALDPVNFAVNSTEPPADAQPYLQKLADLLAERPQLRIRLCGVATDGDRLALLAIEEKKAKRQDAIPDLDNANGTKPQVKAAPIVIADEVLMQLARSRSEALKDYLVGKLGVAAERLFICQPEIDADKEAMPRVELMI